MKIVFTTKLLPSTPAPKNTSATYGVSEPGVISTGIARISCG
jgi:hypothetical protein